MATISALHLALRGHSKEISNALRSKEVSLPRSHGIKRSSQSGMNMPLKRRGSNSIGRFDNVIKSFLLLCSPLLRLRQLHKASKNFAAFISLGANL